MMEENNREEQVILLDTEVEDVLGAKKKMCLQKRYYKEIHPLKSGSPPPSGLHSNTIDIHALTSEERLRNIQGMMNIVIVGLAVLISLFINYTVMVLVSPWWEKPLINEPACLTALNISLALLGVFLFFVNESFAEDFELALDRRCSAFLVKFITMLAFALFLLVNGLLIFIIPSVYGIIYEEKYFSKYVLEGYHRVGICCCALSAWCCYIAFHKLATRIVQRKAMIEKDIVSFFLQKQRDMVAGEIVSLNSRDIYEHLKKNNGLKCSYSRLRKCAIKLLYKKRNCKNCKTIQNALQFMGKMSKDELLSIRKI